MKTLIVIDMQKDFVDGSLGTPEAQRILKNVRAKIEEYEANNWNIIYTRDTHKENYLQTNEGIHLPVEHCIKGTEGWNLVPEVITEHKHVVIDKPTFGYINWTEILPYYNLDSTNEIELVGLCTDICVISNALILKATYPDIKISVDASCCAGVSPVLHYVGLIVMQSCQIEITNAPMVTVTIEPVTSSNNEEKEESNNAEG